jgi:hypothetical protein
MGDQALVQVAGVQRDVVCPGLNATPGRAALWTLNACILLILSLTVRCLLLQR